MLGATPAFAASLSLQAAKATMVAALGARLGASLSRWTRFAGGFSGGAGLCCCPCVPMHPQHTHATPRATSERRQSIVHLVKGQLFVVRCQLQIWEKQRRPAVQVALATTDN